MNELLEGIRNSLAPMVGVLTFIAGTLYQIEKSLRKPKDSDAMLKERSK